MMMATEAFLTARDCLRAHREVGADGEVVRVRRGRRGRGVHGPGGRADRQLRGMPGRFQEG